MKKEVFKSGFKKGISGFIWMIKIILPISYGTSILLWTGILEHIALALKPLMSCFGLPGIAAIPLIVGGFGTIYGSVAVISVLPLTKEQMILIANFVLICHNMIQETVIQSQSGLKAWKAIIFRIVVATMTMYLLSFFIDTDGKESNIPLKVFSSNLSFWEMNVSWLFTISKLSAKIFFIIMAIMVSMEFAKAMNWIDYVIRPITPVLKIMGLPKRIGLLWLTAVIFGLAYAGAVIVEEAKNADIDRKELQLLQYSIGINHSLIEDPALFLSLGLPPFWLWIPKLTVAIFITRVISFLTLSKEKETLTKQ